MKDSLTINELMRIVAQGYPDEFTDYYWNYDTGTPDQSKVPGDPLALFIVVEIYETFDPKAAPEYQITEAIRVIERALEDIEGVLDALASWRPDYAWSEAAQARISA